MSETLERLKKLIEQCAVEDRQALAEYLRLSLPRHRLEDEWGIDAETILDAILRSSDLTKRGVRGIIAEAVFETKVLPTVAKLGWNPTVIAAGNWPYDALLERAGIPVKIQVKLQRLEAGEPKRFYPKRYAEELFVVEVQKTRTGKKLKKSHGSGANAVKVGKVESEDTRPYRFGEFDILAVNMHPSTRQWEDFRYTLASWLLPRIKDPSLIEIFQPVSLKPNDRWTNNLGICLEWFIKNEKGVVLELRARPPSQWPKLNRSENGQRARSPGFTTGKD